MAYIGQKPVVGNFRKCDALTASATATYNLTVNSVAVVPGSVNQMVVSLNGVIQSPTSAYTISGSQIIFDSALTSSDVIDFILIYGDILDVGTVTDSAITTAKIADNNVTTAKLAATSVTTAKVADDAVTQAKLADESVNEARLQVSNSPTNGYFLSAQSGNTGGLTWAEAGGGDMVKISTSSLSSASSYSTDALNSTYFAYRIIAQITSISSQYALISGRIRNSSSDINSANYTWTVDGGFRYTNNSSGNGTLQGGYAGDTEWHLHGEGGLDTDTGEGVNLIIDLINPSGSSGFKNGFCRSTFLYDSARWYCVDSSFKYASESAYTGFSLYTSAGTMTGTVNLYGIK